MTSAVRQEIPVKTEVQTGPVVDAVILQVFTPQQVDIYHQAEDLLRQALENKSDKTLNDFLDGPNQQFLTEDIGHTGKTPMAMIRERIEAEKAGQKV